MIACTTFWPQGKLKVNFPVGVWFHWAISHGSRQDERLEGVLKYVIRYIVSIVEYTKHFIVF